MNDQGMACDYEFLDVNEAYEQMMNVKASKILNKRFYEVFPEGWEGEWQWKDHFNNAILNQKMTQFDMNHYSIQKWIRVTAFPLSTDIFACIYSNVTKEYMLDSEIEGFLAVNPDMLCVASTDGEFIKVNQKFEHILGYPVNELEGRKFLSLIHPEDIPSALEVMKDLEEQKSIMSFINRVICKDGSIKYLEWKSQPNGKYIYSSARDITKKHNEEMELIKLTEKLQEKNKLLKTLAVTDELTGLYNRHFIDQRVEELMEVSDRYHEPLSLIILDLDHFKHVNDKWGHPVGDEVLKHIAELTSGIIRRSDILARFGGEEFVILLPKCTLHDALFVAEKIRKHMETNQHPKVGIVTASFGVAEKRIYESFYSWYKRTDEALYLAKKRGRNRVVISEVQEEDTSVAFVHIEWKNEWDCGNEVIDRQHRELIELGNRLIFMSLSNEKHDAILHQLDIVLKSVKDHFDLEEEILKNIGYPELEEHAAIHSELVHKAQQLKNSYLNGVLKSSAFFSFIVDDIIVGHILDSDRDYYSYIQFKTPTRDLQHV